MLSTIISTETECLTVADDPRSLGEFLTEMSQLAPSLPGSGGFFNAYGRVYLDGPHLEFAAAECSDPFQLVQIINAQQTLARVAAGRLRKRGRELLLANCNHSGLLTDHSPTWGSHGNFLVADHPSTFGDRLLPFLVTRVYAGAGGIHWPSGDFFSGVRLQFLKRDQGGDTTQQRAIHSTCRNEPLTRQPEQYGWRYHTVLGDGLRSHFSLLLRFGVTALVLHAILANPQQPLTIPAPNGQMWQPSFWVQAVRHFNRLERNELGLHASPLAIDVQRVYFELVDKYVQALGHVPPWMPQVMVIWEATLNALERCDHDWLALRLDPWIKHSLIAAYLDQVHATWDELATNQDLACGVALLNQDYHDFTAEDSPFTQLEATGQLKHRVGELPIPGQEPDPFVPDLGTRATLRARLIKHHAQHDQLTADWEQITGPDQTVQFDLSDPFAGVNAAGINAAST